MAADTAETVEGACRRCGAPLAQGGAGRPTIDEIVLCPRCAREDAKPPHESASRLLAASLAEAATRIPMTDEAVIALLRRSFAGDGEIYIYPHVPASKEAVARRVHGVPTDETILALYDDTVLGSSEDGFVVTRRRVSWKNEGEEARTMRFSALDPEDMWAEGRRLHLGGDVLVVTADPALLGRAADAFYLLAISARPPAPTESTVTAAGSKVTVIPGTTSPPPAGISYDAYAAHVSSDPPPRFSCWHCLTPLDERSPSCAWCGAHRTPKGWRGAG